MEKGGARFGVFFSQVPPYHVLAEHWRRAEALGFDSIHLADHLTQFGPAISLEAWTLLGALARETSRVRLGTLVTPIAFRHPVVLAMSAITVDHISAGRLDLGLGAGGGAKDHAALGLAPWDGRERIERLEEQIAIVDALLRGESVTREGRHYNTDASLGRPIQQPRPPITIAAQTPRALRLAALYADTWNTLGGQPVWGPDRVSLDVALAETRQQIDALNEACLRAGRDPMSIRHSMLAYKAAPLASVDAFTDFVGRYHESGIHDFVFSVRTAGDAQLVSDQTAVLERVATEVIPRLREGSGRGLRGDPAPENGE